MARANFARGFEVGFNAVDSVIRQADARKERERRNQREDEKWSFEKDRLENERSYQREMADAGRAPEQGMAIGAPGAKNFAAGKADQQFLAEQDAAIAELEGRAPSAAQLAAGSGNQIMDRNDPRAQDTRVGRLARLADVQLRHGKADEALKTEEIANAIRKSGVKDAMDYLFASGGDAAGAQRIREQAMGPMGGTLIAEKATRKGADGTEYPDFKLSIRDGEGNVRELGSAFSMMYLANNPAEYHKLLQSENKAKGEAERGERQLAQGDRRLDIAQQQANTTESWRRDQMTLALERAANAGSAGGEAPGFQPLSTTDEKAVREFLAENLPQGADINVATDIAARIRSANPNMSLSEAATLASTPGVTVRNVQTNAGVLPALVVPGRPVKGADGKEQPGQPRIIVMAPGARSHTIAQEAAPQPPAGTAASAPTPATIASTDSPVLSPGVSAAEAAASAQRMENAAFERETREIEQGRRREYSPATLAAQERMQAERSAQRRKAEQDWAERERQRQLARSREIAGAR